MPKTLMTTLQRWGVSPEQAEPVVRLIRDMVLSNAIHRAQAKHAKWAAGAAREPHFAERPETPGALTLVLTRVERVIADHEALDGWTFDPPIERRELNEDLRPTGRTVRLTRLDEDIRKAFTRARSELWRVHRELREATQRHRGRKATLVRPFRVGVFFSSLASSRRRVSRRTLVKMLREQILPLHPNSKGRPREARAEAGHLARPIIDAVARSSPAKRRS
jgi:hypothetical protein